MAQALINAVDPQVLALSEMELAEKLIFEACASSVAAVSLGAAHVMRAGGKRIRPMVLILAAKSCGCEEAERVARLSAAVELVHTATLVHDDVVDESDRRRGQYSVNTFLGNEASVLMGDYLVCRALRMIADEPDVRLMRTMCDVIVSMCEAEVLQITYRGDVENTFENYLRVIRNKTACLFSYTAMAGALIGGASEAQVEAFRTFGLNLGIAFQIVDDIL
ncbi:MAG: polyprenyl synthetase family protein, partial [Armatimonadota bacterium]|nr:polyprenyl synthetase family protein [Armatimonadota bacterium]